MALNINLFDNLRFEYSLGATVLMCSIIDTSTQKNVLVPNNVSKIIIEYEYDNHIYEYEHILSFHVNSNLIIIQNLPADHDILFTPYIIGYYNNQEFKIKLTETINEHTLPIGNIEYELISSGDTQHDNQVREKMDEILLYINNLGTCVIGNNPDAQHARTIPVQYDSNVQTAEAQYYKIMNSSDKYGMVKTSGGTYFKNDVMYHELRHRYGIYYVGSDLTRDELEGRSAKFSYIEDKFSVIHDAIKFETGRNDAKAWVFEAHSNIPEGNYTNDGDYNYLAANYIKALVWYTCHTTDDQDESKIRTIIPISTQLLYGQLDQPTQHNITLNINNGFVNINKQSAILGEEIIISNISINQGYKIDSISIKTGNNQNVSYTYDEINNIIRFTMPDDDVIVNINTSQIIIEVFYNISLQIDNGVATIDKQQAKANEMVHISNVIPNEGYDYHSLMVHTSSGIPITCLSDGYGFSPNITWAFTMPNEDVIVSIGFIKIPDQNNQEEPNEQEENSKEESYTIIEEDNNSIKSSKKIVNIGPYQYLYEYLKNGIDFDDINCSDHFVILRNFEIINNVIYDKDIFFINESIYNQIINNSGENLICYPLYKNGNLFFSDIYGYFASYNMPLKDITYHIKKRNNINSNKGVINTKFISNENGNIQLYSDYEESIDTQFNTDENGNTQLLSNQEEFINSEIEPNIEKDNNDIIESPKILCDKIRIYNPTINKDLDFIIYVDNYINNIHFHYFCNLNKNFKKKYIGEIKVNNNRYIEYIEINVPNLSNLFNIDNGYFIEEDLNKVMNFNNNDFENNEIALKSYFNQNNLENSGAQQLSNELYLSLIIKPFFIDKKIPKVPKRNKDGEIVYKLDEEGNSTDEPVLVEDINNAIYIKTYMDDNYFNYQNNYYNTSLNITLYPYKGIANNLYLIHDIISSSSTFIPYESYFNLSSKLGFDNGTISLINEFIFPNKIQTDNKEEIDNQVQEYYNSFYLHENLSKTEEELRDEFDEELDVEAIRSTGFLIQISNDLKFENVLLESVINTDNKNNENFIYDFSFSLDNMIYSWSQLNDTLIARAKFIDKKLNVVITGNNVVINKEWLKYFINNTRDQYIRFDKVNNLILDNFMDIRQGFNFIDNINCVITEDSYNIKNSSNNIINTKLIYKPIFYKVNDLQNIRLRQGVTQNIGVNLGDFMNKVNTFILNIDNQTIKESSRNDVFVIFSINANNIENNSGYYNILNENFEYISSGNYMKY